MYQSAENTNIMRKCEHPKVEICIYEYSQCHVPDKASSFIPVYGRTRAVVFCINLVTYIPLVLVLSLFLVFVLILWQWKRDVAKKSEFQRYPPYLVRFLYCTARYEHKPQSSKTKVPNFEKETTKIVPEQIADVGQRSA